MWFSNVFDMTLGHGLVSHYRYGFDTIPLNRLGCEFDIWYLVFGMFGMFFHGLGTQWLFWGSWWVGLKKGHRNTWYNFDTVLIQFWKQKWYASDMILRCVQNISQKTQQKLNKQKSQLWLLTHIKIIAAKKGSTKQENIPDTYQDHSIHKANTFEHPPSKKAWWCHNIVSKLTKYISLNIHSNSQYLLTMTKSTRNPVIFPWWSALLPWLVLKLLDLFLRARIKH